VADTQLEYRGDHPRVRGEHPRSTPGAWCCGGSSPRARGALGAICSADSPRGIIPACAGSTLVVVFTPGAGRDHPRVRGEHLFPAAPVPPAEGSSPRARGAPPTHRLSGVGVGIIPACAGSTSPGPRGDVRRGDHPRVRGEHLFFEFTRLLAEGSSPRARGAPGAYPSRRSSRGIIPACAGSTAGPSCQIRRSRDHPRVRGEHVAPPSSRGNHSGSSPRARGAHGTGTALPRQEGIIPACAGSTADRSSRRPPTGDHPRVRGEHIAPARSRWSAPGSSPRARGAPLGRASPAAAAGIIPACAGSTAAPSPA